MNCYDFEKLLDYSEAELAPQERAPQDRKQIDAHLANCADCRQKLDTLHDSWTNLDCLEEIDSAADFNDQVVNRLKASPANVKQFPILYTILAIAAAVLLVIGIVFYNNNDTPEPSQNLVDKSTPTNIEDDELSVLIALDEQFDWDLEAELEAELEADAMQADIEIYAMLDELDAIAVSDYITALDRLEEDLALVE